MSIAAGRQVGLVSRLLKIFCVIIPILVALICVGLAIGSEEPSSAPDAGGSSAAAATSEAGKTKPDPAATSEAGRTKPEIEFTPGAKPHGLEKTDLVVGTGAEATPGTEVTVHYIVVLNKSGKEVESSWGGKPYSFELGSGQVAAGWERGIEGMKVGGRRELVAPSALAFGKAGVKGVIGPNEDLRYVIDLVKVKPAPASGQG
jgi:peptidylprolyl isomerase